MTRMIITVIGSYVLTLILGRVLLPVLRALKAGQSIREIGPTWHNSKAGTPMMGGLMFIIGIFITIFVLGWQGMLAGDYSHLYVFGFALVFGVIGYIDDYQKVKRKQNTGLTSRQKFLLQLAAAVAFLCLMRFEGMLSPNLYIPFFDVSFRLHPILYIFFAMFVMVGCVNAVNLTDGVDGLCGLTGFVTKPTATRGNRNYQQFFVNGRPVKSRMMMAALEEAYRNRIMVGKFPACVLQLTLPATAVDVNVHPAKTEVKFLNEKAVFDCIHYGVLGALNKTPDRPDVQFKSAPAPTPVSAPATAAPKQEAPKQQSFFRTMTASEYQAFTGAVKNAPQPSPLAAAAVAAAVERSANAAVKEQVKIIRINTGKSFFIFFSVFCFTNSNTHIKPMSR